MAKTAFKIEPDAEGFIFYWGEEAYVHQSFEQTIDLIETISGHCQKLVEALRNASLR